MIWWTGQEELEIEYWSRFDDHYERYHREVEDLRRDWEYDNIDWEEEDHWELILQRADNGEL